MSKPKSSIAIFHCHDVWYYVDALAEVNILPASTVIITVTITLVVTEAVISLDLLFMGHCATYFLCNLSHNLCSNIAR